MIDRYLLRYFLAVVDAGNFSRAAAATSVSQPTLSVGISRLETLLGTRLFHRSNRRVSLTEAGGRLLPHARRIEGGFNAAEAAVALAPAARPLRLGVLATLPAPWIAALLRALRLDIVEGSARDLRVSLERGRIDMAVTLGGSGAARFAHETILREGYAMVLPVGHRLAREEAIDGAALADETMIVRRHCEALAETSRYFVERGVRPHFALRTHSDDRALAMIAGGIGITLMPMGFRHAGVAGVPLAGFDLSRDIGLQTADHAHDPIAGAAATTIREAILHAARR